VLAATGFRSAAWLGAVRRHLNRTGRVTTTEAIELLGVSRPTAIRHLQHLVDADLLEAVCKSLNDPRGHWRTVVKGS
jgi:predicted ArsR family transcriptional regulator